MEKYLSVTTLTKYLKMKFDKDPYLERVYLTGQVSNFRKRPTHQYFSLKDDNAVIQATIWSGIYQKLGFDLEEGMKINVVGRVQIYEPSGSYSIIIEKVEPDGVGALAIQFEQLKKKLTEEGLFQERFKQPLPQFSKRIGVVTSRSGAVIRDIITTVSRRFPGVDSSAAAVGVAARRSATKSAKVTSVSCPTLEITGKRDSKIARTTISSLKAQRSSIEPPPRPIISKSKLFR